MVEELSSQLQDLVVEAVQARADQETGSETGRGRRGYYQGLAPSELLPPALRRKPIVLYVNLEGGNFKKTNSISALSLKGLALDP